MADIEQKIKLSFENNAEENAQEVNKLTASIDKTTDATNENKSSVGQSDAAYKSFKTQLREANAELQKSIQLYGETAKETVEAAKQVANLKDQMGFAKDLTDKFNPDQKMKALGAATQVAGTGLQGVTAGMALFGAEGEDTQKQLLKVQAAMAFSDAISNLSNLGDQWQLLKATIASSSLATKANAAATGLAAMVQNVFTGSVATTTTGFKALKFAIAATGIGLLVVGLVAVYQNFDKISKFATNLVPALSKVGDTVMSIVNAVSDFIGVTSAADRAVDKLKANAKASTSLNDKYLAEHGDQLDKFTKQKIEARNAYNKEIEAGNYDAIALGKKLNRELAAIEYSRGDDQRKIQADNAQKAKDAAAIRKQKAKEDSIKATEEEAKAEADFQIWKKDLLDKLDDSIFAGKLAKGEENAAKEKEENTERVLEEASAVADKAEEDGNNRVILLEDKKRTAEEEAQFLIDKDNAIAASQQNLNNIISNLESAGLAKSKAGQAVQKALALTQIGMDTARAFSTATPMAIKAGEEAAKVAGPAAPVVGPIVTGLSYASSAATIIGNIARAKKLLSGGGAGSSSSAGGGSSSGAPSSASATPQVNFQASSENQIGNTMAGKLNAQAPIRVTVLESDITKTQTSVQAKVVSNSF